MTTTQKNEKLISTRLFPGNLVCRDFSPKNEKERLFVLCASLRYSTRFFSQLTSRATFREKAWRPLFFRLITRHER